MNIDVADALYVAPADLEEWLAEWAERLMLAQAAAWAESNGSNTAGVELSIRVEPDSYESSPDGRDWAGSPAGSTVSVLAYEDSGGHEIRSDLIRYLRQAIAAAVALPSGMGWRHCEIIVSVRPYHRTSPMTFRSGSVAERHVAARVGGRGLRLVAA